MLKNSSGNFGRSIGKPNLYLLLAHPPRALLLPISSNSNSLHSILILIMVALTKVADGVGVVEVPRADEVGGENEVGRN